MQDTNKIILLLSTLMSCQPALMLTVLLFLNRGEKLARITVKEIVNTPVENYSKMKTEEMEKTLNAFRVQLKRRLNNLDKGGHYSYAFQGLYESLGKEESQLEKDADTDKVKHISLMSTLQDTRTMSRNQMLHEIAAIQSFFLAKTSTVSGIKIVNKDQDKRVFEDTYTSMTDDQRERYWKFIAEAERIMPLSGRSELYASTQIQNMMANLKIELGLNFEFQDLGTMADEALARLHAENTHEEYKHWSKADPVFVYDTPIVNVGSYREEHETKSSAKSKGKSKSSTKAKSKAKSKTNTKTNSKTKTNTNTKPKNNTKREHVPKTFKDRFFAGLNKLGSLFTK